MYPSYMVIVGIYIPAHNYSVRAQSVAVRQATTLYSPVPIDYKSSLSLSSKNAKTPPV